MSIAEYRILNAMSNVHEINIVIRYPALSEIYWYIRQRLLSENGIIDNKLTSWSLTLKKVNIF